ncbi:unnamed protein product, partial [Strongylus vulgaris]
AQKAANEGVRDAVLDLHRWLDDYEQRAGISRDIPLVEESLNELKREVQLLRMDLDSRIAVSKDLAEDLSKLSASNPPEWKNMIEEKLKKAVLRLQRISTDLRGFRDNVNDALEGVVKLESNGTLINRSCDSLSSNLKMTNARDLPRLQEIAAELDSMNSQLIVMRSTAENIKQIPNVSGTEAVDIYIDGISNKVNSLKEELEAKYSQQAEVGHLEMEFENIKQRLNQWLGQFDKDMEELEPVSIQSEKLQVQKEQLSSMMHKHKEGLTLVEELDSIATRLGDAEESSYAGNRLSAIPRVAMDLLTRYNAQADTLRRRSEKVDTAAHKAAELLTAEEELRSWIAVQNKNLSECGVPTTMDALHSLQTTLERLNKSRRAEQRRLDDVGDNCTFMIDRKNLKNNHMHNPLVDVAFKVIDEILS